MEKKTEYREPELTLEDAKNYLKMEVELSLTKDKLAQSQLYIDLVAKHAH